MMRKRRPENKNRQVAKGDETEMQDPLDTAVSSDPGPDRLMLSGELGEQVRVAMMNLSAVERTAFVMRHFEGNSIEEIGATLGLGAGATKNSVFRAVQKLRQHLGPLVGHSQAKTASGEI
jgi:RNA polymerase sigma-70 factor (ECF subfamily)